MRYFTKSSENKSKREAFYKAEQTQHRSLEKKSCKMLLKKCHTDQILWKKKSWYCIPGEFINKFFGPNLLT